jgi:ubiquinone/menaquinone biosynthesis C-methylase UbiE
MDYIKTNKDAWEDAFAHRFENWGDDNHIRLRTEKLPFLEDDVIKALSQMNLEGKTIAQFCCNNGRELLSVMQLGAERGVGFDIAENILNQAKETAQKIKQTNCEFVQTNILEINESYHNRFDFIFFTIGAITWFEDLNQLFRKVSDCLKPNGVMLINDSHPFFNLLLLPGEEGYDENNLDRFAYSYFRSEPWVESEGMSYLSPMYESKPFTSFSHTISEILNGTIKAGMTIQSFDEYDYDVGMTELYNGKGYPLSYILIAAKRTS